MTGPSIRLRQFVEPFIRSKYQVLAVMLEDQRRSAAPIEGAVAAEAFDPEQIRDPAFIASETDLSFVQAVFGVGSLLPAAAAARLAEHLGVACWIDFFGDPLAELHAAQLRQGGLPDTAARDHAWKLMREGLLRGDAFSSVSAPQRHAILGQLGLLGRYGIDWEVCNRVSEIPCAVPDDWVKPEGRREFPQALRDRGLDESTRYVFFGGSWNVWLDEATMAKALRRALEIDSSLYFVSCGIPTGPAGEQIHQALMIDLRDFCESGRVIELPPQHIDVESELLAWAGGCISLDRPIPEAELGSRNRLLAMIRHGARPVVSVEAGLEAELVAAGLAAGIVDGNWDRAGKEIIAACSRSPGEREADRLRGLEWLQGITFQETMQPALNWLARKAPRWPAPMSDGLVDRWAAFPPDPEALFPQTKKRSWFFG